jgi:hypothetical protein
MFFLSIPGTSNSKMNSLSDSNTSTAGFHVWRVESTSLKNLKKGSLKNLSIDLFG